MHGAMRRMSISTGQASAGGSGTSNELSNSTKWLLRFCALYKPSAAPCHRSPRARRRRVALHRLGRQVGELGLIGVLHLRLHAVLGELLREGATHLRPLIGVVDLVAADPPADPGGRHA